MKVVSEGKMILTNENGLLNHLYSIIKMKSTLKLHSGFSDQ